MDLQTILDNAVKAQRAEQMKTSDQLTLGELILLMQNVKNKDLPIYFDDEKYFPNGLKSWRGSYCELCIEYSDVQNLKTVTEFLYKLQEAMGKTFTGYKGGDFIMGKTTPLWVANYGQIDGFKDNENGDSLAVVGLEEKSDKVIIKTELKHY